MNGYLGLILTGHVPYVRSAGRDPYGEDALHETIAQAIVPTLKRTFRPARAWAAAPAWRWPTRRCCSSSWAIRSSRSILLSGWSAGSSSSSRIWRDWEATGEEHRVYLARFYLDWGQGVLRSFEGRYGRNLVARCASCAPRVSSSRWPAPLPTPIRLCSAASSRSTRRSMSACSHARASWGAGRAGSGCPSAATAQRSTSRCCPAACAI